MTIHRIFSLFFIFLIVVCCGCESITGKRLSKSEASMDYNPRWENQDEDRITGFDQLPRRKNRLSKGYAT